MTTIIIIIMVIGLTTYIVYDKVTNVSKLEPSQENNVTDKNMSNGQNNELNNATNENYEIERKIVNSDEKYTDSDFIRNTKIVIYEKECAGGSEALVANIDNNKDIVFTGSAGLIYQPEIGSSKEMKVDAKIESANAKYIYSIGIIACNVNNLYYITTNNELYLIPSDAMYNITINNQKNTGIKISDNKVLEFLGRETIEKKSYIKVLLEDGRVEYIKYFEAPQ